MLHFCRPPSLCHGRRWGGHRRYCTSIRGGGGGDGDDDDRSDYDDDDDDDDDVQALQVLLGATEEVKE